MTKLNLKKPIAFFDLETTGVNVSSDRVVEISILKIHVNGQEELKTERVNPQMPIPVEASLVHGIYDDDVKDKPSFKQLAKDIAKFMEGCDLGGYNLLKFDIPLLVEEFLRAEVDFDIKNRSIVDAQRIFHFMEPRTLTAAYKFYCQKELENAHSAEADTIATYEVLKAQLQMYEGKTFKDKKGNDYQPIKNDMNTLSALNDSNFADLLGRIVFDDRGEEIFNFGKHKGKRVREVFKFEPQYYDWMMKNDFPLYTKKILTQIKLSMI